MLCLGLFGRELAEELLDRRRWSAMSLALARNDSRHLSGRQGGRTKSPVVSTLAHIFEVACAYAFIGNDRSLPVIQYRGLCASPP